MIFTEAIQAGFGAVRRSKRLVLCAALTTALVSLPFAIWMGRAVHAVGSRRPDATAVTKALDPDLFADVRQANPLFDASAATLVVASLILAFAVRPLVWGGYCGIAAASKRLSFARFVREGGAVYWKFVRISVLEVLLVVAASVALKPVLDTFEDFIAKAPSEDAARDRTWAAQAIAFGTLCVVAMIADYARVGVRMRRRPGVLAELGRSALFVLQHPLRTTALYAVGLVLEIALCLPVLLLIRWGDGAYVPTSVGVLVLGQAVIALREGARLFHVAAAYAFREAEERPRQLAQARPEADGADLLEERMPWHVS